MLLILVTWKRRLILTSKALQVDHCKTLNEMYSKPYWIPKTFSFFILMTWILENIVIGLEQKCKLGTPFVCQYFE